MCLQWRPINLHIHVIWSVFSECCMDRQGFKLDSEDFDQTMWKHKMMSLCTAQDEVIFSSEKYWCFSFFSTKTYIPLTYASMEKFWIPPLNWKLCIYCWYSLETSHKAFQMSTHILVEKWKNYCPNTPLILSYVGLCGLAKKKKIIRFSDTFFQKIDACGRLFILFLFSGWVHSWIFFFFFFFLFGFYGPFKNISLISSWSFIEGGRKPENPEKNHLTIRKQNLAFPHMTRARLKPQRWET